MQALTIEVEAKGNENGEWTKVINFKKAQKQRFVICGHIEKKIKAGPDLKDLGKNVSNM